MSELFRVKERKYNLQNDNALVSNIPRSTNYGLNTISHLAPKIWEIIPNGIKSCKEVAHATYVGHMCTMWVTSNCNLYFTFLFLRSRICYVFLYVL